MSDTEMKVRSLLFVMDTFPEKTTGVVDTVEMRKICNSWLALRAENERLREALLDLANASDTVGIAYFDTDDMPPNVVEMQRATVAARRALERKPE